MTSAADSKSSTVLITGCSSGFGRSLVARFLARGWRVVATMRQAEKRRTLFEEELRRYGSKQLAIVNLDVTRGEDIAALVEWVRTELKGRLDVLVNNAGYGAIGAVEDSSEEQIRHQMEVNFFGPLFLTRALLPFLRETQGKVIHITSVLGYSSLPLHSMYCASKFALEGLGEAMDHELGMLGVQTCLVEPGAFGTEFTENRIWGERSKSGDSPYYPLTMKVEEFLAARPKSKFGKPEKVVERVAELAELERMPLRAPVGTDARLVAILTSLLPRNLLARLLRSVFRRVIFKQSS